MKYHRLYLIYFAVNAPPNNGRRNTPMPTSENNTTPIDTTATAAMTYLIVFFISYNIKVFLMIFFRTCDFSHVP